MGKVMLIAGKDYPDDFVKNIVARDYSVAIAKSSDIGEVSSIEQVATLKWHKASPVSARSMILGTENSFGAIDVVVLYFDAPIFATQFTDCTIEDVSGALDSLVVSFQYLAVETFARFAQKKINGKLVFLLKTHPSLAETMRSSAQRNSASKSSSPVVATAQAAFAAFAENFAAMSLERQYGSVVLVSVRPENELSTRDGALATWLGEYLALLENKEKNSRQLPAWVKAGAKSGGFLSRFSSGVK